MGFDYSAQPMVLAWDILAIMQGKSIKVFDFGKECKEPKLKFCFEGHTDLVTKVAIVKDQDALISCSNDHTAKVWCLSTGKLRNTLRGHKAAVSGCYLFHTCANYCLTVSYDNKVMMWDFTAAEFADEITAKAANEEAKKDAKDKGLSEEDLVEYQVGDIKALREFSGHTDMLNAVAISPDDQMLLTAGEATLRVWNMVGEEKFKCNPKNGVVDMVLARGYLYVATYGHELEVYDTRQGKLIGTVEVHTKSINDVEASPDGSIVVCGSSDGKGSIVTVEDDEVKCISTFGPEGGESIASVAICPTHNHILYASGPAVCVIDLESREIIVTLKGFTLDVCKVLYSADGESILASADDGQTMIWAADTFELIAELKPAPPSQPSKRKSVEESVEEVKDEDVPHVMISYNWGHQPIVERLNQALKARGYKVWIDTEQMAGSTLGAMADAVDGASAIIMCVSEKYSQSPNCRAEAEYSFTVKKRIIPLMMERNYRAKGWLGFVMGSKLWTAFWEESEFEEQLEMLCKELGDLGKVGTGGGGRLEASAPTPAPKGPSQEEKVLAMDVKAVASWLQSVTSCNEEVSEKAKHHDIDGAALLCLQSIAKKDELQATRFFQESLGATLGVALRLTRALQAPIRTV